VGRDIGLGFRVCNVSKLSGLDLLGDGATSTAWTATDLADEAKCNRAIDDSHLVAVDVIGDGRVDASWEALEWCVVCRPFGGADFDGDGDDELVVLEQGGSVSSFLIFSVEKRPGGSLRLFPLKVAEPGNRKAALPPGRPLRFWVGGDEGGSANVACENYPEDPIFVVTTSYSPVEGPGSETTEIRVTSLSLRDGVFHVVDTTRTEQPTDQFRPQPSGGPSKTCGLALRHHY
jgi:hypothetical protein